MKQLFLVVAALIMTGCASVASDLRPAGSYSSAGNQPISGNFLGMDAALSDQEIEKILNYRVRLPELNRVAIVNISSHFPQFGWPAAPVSLSEQLVDRFIGRIEATSRVYDAAFLPAMLLPEQVDAVKLRAAAARFQADVLLVYRTSCQSFTKRNFIEKDELNAYCSVESVLLDVRSGIVPFSMVTSHKFNAKENRNDMSFYETTKKAEFNAISESLIELANKLSGFLEQVDSYNKG